MRNDKFKHLLVLVFATFFFVAVAAWAKTYTFQATSIAPGATGTVDAKSDKAGGNTTLAVKVEHLARPNLLTPPASEYVVWVEPQGGQPTNEGVLRVADSEKGDLKITTSAAKFTVIVTAESDTHPSEPSHRVVLRAEVQE